MNTTTAPACNQSNLPDEYRYTLLSMYTVALVVGVSGIAPMLCSLVVNSGRSVITIAMFNLVAVHTVFLLTLPFRMYYYACGHWDLGLNFCKFISAMIHGHMYITFIFYIIILVVRAIAFLSRRDRLEFYRKLHALAASLTVWVVILGVILPVTVKEYGSDVTADKNQCFNFGKALEEQEVAVLNYLLCAVLLLVTFAFLAIQLWILGMTYKKYGKTAPSHQEFWAQVKSLCFVMVILICFAPYHAFRIYYVTKYFVQKEECLVLLQFKNEIFLAVTAFSCSDMLIFVLKKRWSGILCPCVR